ncbi:unnamed protein product [Calypogeia fissa]
MVSLAIHIPGHVARLKEEAYVISNLGDLFYPFAVEVFGAFHPALDRFLRALAALCVERQPYPRSRWLRPFLGSVGLSGTAEGAGLHDPAESGDGRF